MAIVSEDVTDEEDGLFSVDRIFNTVQAPSYPATFPVSVTGFFRGSNEDRGIRQPITVRLTGDPGQPEEGNEWTMHVVLPREPAVLPPVAHATFTAEDGLTLPSPGYYRFTFFDPDGGEIGDATFLAIKT